MNIDNDINKQIEKIDIELYNLLMQRADLVKKHSRPIRIENILGQEAMGIRRMLKYHTGDFPQYVVAKIWREILSASVNMKEKLKIAVFGDENDTSLMHQVQEHFGSYLDVSFMSSFSQTFNMVSQHEADLAIIPSNNQEMNVQPWWSALATDPQKESLNIVAKLPFVRNLSTPIANEAYVVSLSPADASGIDNSLFTAETDKDVSNSLIVETLLSMGYEEAKIAAMVSEAESKFSLIEVKGFVSAEAFQKQEIPEVFKRLRLAGTYAKPIEL